METLPVCMGFDTAPSYAYSIAEGEPRSTDDVIANILESVFDIKNKRWCLSL